MVVAASRGEGRRDDADPGQSRKDQGQAQRRRSRTGRYDRKATAAAAGLDRALDDTANQSPPPRHHHSCPGDGTRRDRQSAGAAAQSPEGRVRTILGAWQIKTPRPEPRRLIPFPRMREACPQSFFRKPENFFWNRDTRPPRSRICWAPPIQAGCDLESMSRLSLSPSLPQVERVRYSVPSVITTVII